ncbi:hypothetical protein Tco_0752630 [Tanacetum coccineum]|uniref:Uncharacterized protein n=1 Tax=Tanacetum coccineum TaxID=301880 RepID=A0ABQ4Z7E3_9ASTR
MQIISLLKRSHNRRKARIVHSDDEDIEDDSSKQGRKLSDAEVQEKASTETEPIIQEVTPTEVIQDQGSTKASKKIDWNDPSVIRYHALKMKPKTIAQARRNMINYLKNQGNYKISDFKGMSYNEIRLIFEKVWDFNQHIEPMSNGSVKMEDLLKRLKNMIVDYTEEMKKL